MGTHNQHQKLILFEVKAKGIMALFKGFLFLGVTLCFVIETQAEVKQWVKLVKGFDTQWNRVAFGAHQVVGKPDVYPEYGNKENTYSASKKPYNLSIILEYENKVIPQSINIYETYYAGGVVGVDARDSEGQWHSLWTGTAEKINESRIFSPPLKRNNIETNTIRLQVDLSEAGKYIEYDAIELVGSYTESQFVSNVTKFASEYNSGAFGSKNVIGKPDLYPIYGEFPNKGWTAESKRATGQYLDLKFEHAAIPTSINIYETYHCGAAIGVEAKDPRSGTWVSLWSTDAPQLITESRIFSPPLKPVDFKTNELKVKLDFTAAKSWYYIDAVEMVGICEEFNNNVLTRNLVP